MNSISDRELLENRDRVEQLRFTASVVGELIARNQIELVLGSDAAWKMIRELAEERCFQALREIRNVLDDSGLTDRNALRKSKKSSLCWRSWGSAAAGGTTSERRP